MKYAFAFLFFISLQIVGQQNNTLSIQFENSLKKDVFKQIEAISQYRFYYVDEWIDEKRVSGNYSNSSIQIILNDVFKSTFINYYITDESKVILTKNALIHATLPRSFLQKKEDDSVKKEDVSPVFYVDKSVTKNINTRVIRIGKEDTNTTKSNFVVSGYVKNSQTNKPISNVVVVINNKNKVTNTAGYYSFTLKKGAYTVETKAIGVVNQTKKIVVYNDGVLNFTLDDSSDVLDEVVIVGEVDKNVKQAITGVLEINVEEIKTIPLVLGERDILKVAATLPGITKAGEGSSGYNIRGGKTDQNLMLLDNGVLYNPSHFFGIFSAVNPFTTGNVKIYKGSAPANYGGRLSSVIDITSKKASTEKFSGEASIGPVTSNVMVEIPIEKEKSSLLLGARGTYSNWILKSLDDTSLKNSSASFYDLIAKYSHKFDAKNNLEATAYYSYDDFSITSDSLHTFSNNLVSVKWDRTINDKHKGSLILSSSQYKFNIAYDGTSNTNFDLDYKISETQLKLNMKYAYSDKHKLDYGISTKLYNINPGSKVPKGVNSIITPTVVPKEQALESAIFVSDNFKVTDKLELDLGMRYSIYNALGKGTHRIYAEGLPKNAGTLIDSVRYGANDVIKTYSGPEIRASLRYLFSPSFSFKASYNSTYQYIQSLSNNTTASPTDTWKLSDGNIKPQKSDQVTVGFYKNLQDNLYEISLEGYYKNSNNILDYKVGADLLINKSIETEVLQGKGRAYGVELLIKKNSGRLNGWLGYSYSRSMSKFDSPFAEERINNGTYFPSNYDKPHDISLVSNYKLTKRFSFSMNFAYQSGRPVTYPVGNYTFNGSQYVFYSENNKFRIPDYYRLDLGFNIEGNHRIKKFIHSFWNISIYNVLGRNNPYSVFFVTKQGKIQAYKSTIFSIPIPTISYNFKF